MTAPPLDEALSARLGRPVRCAACTGSTNDDAQQLGRQGAPHGALVMAERQRQGRGRLGRSWLSQPGENLTFSLLLRPDCEPSAAPLITLAAGVALAEVSGARLKWPNDVLDHADRKLAGLLAELDVRQGRVRFVVLGVGLNVNQREFPPQLPQAGSLALMAGRSLDRMALLERLLPAIEAWTAMVASEPAAVLTAWRRHSATLGRAVQVGAQRGVAEDLRADGALLLRLDDGELIPVLAGDVLLQGRERGRGMGKQGPAMG